MAQLTWVSSASGSWTTGANWSSGNVPGIGDDVIIGVAGITVTFGSGNLFVDSITTTSSVLAVTGGELTIESYSTFGGALSLTGGELNSQGATFISNGGYSQSGASTLVLSGEGGVFNNNVTQTAGTIKLQSGALDFGGAVTTLDGTISGNGTMVVEGELNGLNGTTTITGSTVLSIAKLYVDSGVLSLASTAKPYDFTYVGYFADTSTGTVALGGNTLTLRGRTELGSLISGGGTIVADGGGQLNNLVLDNAAVLEIGSAFAVTAFSNQAGFVTLKNNAQIVIEAKESLRLTGNDSINDATANGLLTDDGTLTRAGGSGTAEILTSFTEASTGTVAISIGTLDFSGLNNVFDGTITGNGTLSLGNVYTGSGSSYSFGSGTVLSSAGFRIGGATTLDVVTLPFGFTYGGNWDQTGGLLFLGTGQSPGPILKLTGSVILDGGVIKSSTGTIQTTGLLSLSSSGFFPLGVDIEGFTVFSVAGTAYQDASIQLGAQSGSKPVALITSTGSWLLEDTASITGTQGTVVNDGTLEKYNGSAESTIDGTLVNNGLLTVAGSTLVLDGSGALSGTISGAGQLDLQGTGTYILGPSSYDTAALSLTVAHVFIGNTLNGPNGSVVALSENLAYAGDWAQNGGTVQLQGNTLTLNGINALDGGTITGPGSLLAVGSTTLGGSAGNTLTISSSAELVVTKAAEQSSDINIGSLGTVIVDKGGVYTMDDRVNIFGSGTLTVGGLLTANGTGSEVIDPATTVNGAVLVSHGELSFLGGVSGTGSLIIGSGSFLDLDNAVSNSTTIDMQPGHASLLIGDAPAYDGIISGFVSTDFIEIQQLVSGSIGLSLNSTDKILTVTDSAQHSYSLTFAQALTKSSLELATGPHGYIGIYHT